MSKISEFTPSNESTVVAKVLVHLHKAIDINFPNSITNQRQFTKTVFSGDNERTAVDQIPNQRRKERSNPPTGVQRIDGKGAGQEFSTGNQTTKIEMRRNWRSYGLMILLAVGICVLITLMYS